MENDIVQMLLNQALRDGPSKLMSDAAHEIFSLRLEVQYYKNQVSAETKCGGTCCGGDHKCVCDDERPIVEFSGGAPLHGAASAGTQGYASGGGKDEA